MKQLSIYDDFYNPQEKPHSAAVALHAQHYSSLKPSEETTKANVTEIILTRDKENHMQSLLPMLTHLNNEPRWLAWIDPPINLLKQWRHQFDGKSCESGKNSCNLLILRSSSSTSAFELTEKALQAGTCHAVIAWMDTLTHEDFSTLENASSMGDSHGIILRHR